MEDIRRLRIAVVGSGMAGLVTAYLLQRDKKQRYAVTLFEEGNDFSLDAASLSVPNRRGDGHERVDLPMRAFAGGFYQNLKAMYDHLQVPYHQKPFLFTFSKIVTQSDGASKQNEAVPYFVHSSNNHRLPPIKPEGMSTIEHIFEILYLLVWYAWFTFCCFYVTPKPVAQGSECETFERYLQRIMLPSHFTNYYLLPLMSSVATCPHSAVLNFPARDIVDYKKKTHRAQHYAVSNGVGVVQRRLARGLTSRMCARILEVKPLGPTIKISWMNTRPGVGTVTEETFDRVILAVAPNVVGSIYEPLRASMRFLPTLRVESMVRIGCQSRNVATYSDKRYVGVADRDSDEKGAQMIHLRTTLGDDARTEAVEEKSYGARVITCPFTSIDAGEVVHASRFTRVLRTPKSRRILNEVFQNEGPNWYPGDEKRPYWKNGDQGVWLVGGWCWDGMVLLEGCVVSAMRVAKAFDVEVPW
ncbi:hypothetical protein M501DRAFT_997998 [Patellaria atrata CBS 101060]|uniref:Amine oxidase domain-containing protein n=1 Tax=Patellaria atrata CBS 101060 TaxID=1346257 RepID=A0A9P4SFB2_9PEZI|nr:hypothetical protein M501DRAFT_997998 [Patellaria atrata CBS 101060]